MSDPHAVDEPENTYILKGLALPNHDALIVALPPVEVAVTPETMDIVRLERGIACIVVVIEVELVWFAMVFKGIVVVY